MTADQGARTTARLPWREVSVGGSLGRSGSAAMVAALLQGTGERVGQLDAVFLHSPLERLSINGEPISNEAAERFLSEKDSDGQERRLEAIAERYFEENAVTWVVRTTAFPLHPAPELAVWTPIVPSRDSSAADETRRLSKEFTRAVHAVAAPQRESVLDVLHELYPLLSEVAKLCQMSRGNADLDGQELRFRTPARDYRLKVPLLGRFQLENAATAILAVEQLVDAGVTLSAETARKALESIRLPGRLEPIKRRPLIIVDAAEQPQALRRVAQTVREELNLRRPVIVFGMTAQTDAHAALEILGPLEPELIVSTAGIGTVIDPSPLIRAWFDAGLQASWLPQLSEALDEATTLAGSSGCLLVTGSRAIAAAARAYILGLLPPAHDLV